MDYLFWLNMHSGVRWLVVLAFLIVLFRCAVGYARKGNFAAIDGRLLSIYSLLTVAQFLLGLLLMGLRGANITTPIILHAIVMIGAVYITARTNGRVKRADSDESKYQIGLMGTGISAVVILVGITIVGGW